MAGVTPTGFEKKTLADLLSEIETDQRNTISPSLNFQADSVIGQNNNIFADKLRELWDVSEAIYRAMYPDSASGDALDNVAAITGAIRLPATKSTVTLTVNINAGTSLPVGRVVSEVNTGVRFVTTESVINTGGSPADFDVDAESEDFGSIQAAAGTLTVIETPATGWNSVTNALDADPGRDDETDADFRVRREQLLRVGGNATVESILSDLRDVENVESVTLLNNRGDVVDSNGLPPHSVEAIMLGGADQDIGEALFRTVAAGTETHKNAIGGVTVQVEDSQGFTEDMNFTRPQETDIWIEIDIEVTDEYEGDAAVKAALVAEGSTLGIGNDVILEAIKAAAFEVGGVFDVTDFKIDTVFPPVGTSNIPIAVRQLARFDTSRVTVNSTPV